MAAQSRPMSTSEQSSSLWNSIVETYDRAQAAQVATITDTSTDVLWDRSSHPGVPFILKIATALRDKPKAPSTSGTAPKKEWRNPFLPPDPDLFVCHLTTSQAGLSHSLVLNKFNIVPHHAIVITREFVPQEEPCTAADFEATWQVMRAMPHGGLAYFNCGPVSGASQPHKHIQVVPLPLNASPSNEGADPPFGKIIEKALEGRVAGPAGAVQLRPLPFLAFSAPLDPETVTGELLEQTHTSLIELAAEAAALATSKTERSFSFNTIAAQNFIMVVPRSRESAGPVSCNAMAFAGSFFVRGTDELEYIRQAGPMKVLAAVGFPNPN